MTRVCPKDGSACPDDLCHGSGCLQMNGYEMLEVCDSCGGTIDHEIPDCGTCTCEEDDDDIFFYFPEEVDDDHL